MTPSPLDTVVTWTLMPLSGASHGGGQVDGATTQDHHALVTVWPHAGKAKTVSKVLRPITIASMPAMNSL